MGLESVAVRINQQTKAIDVSMPNVWDYVSINVDVSSYQVQKTTAGIPARPVARSRKVVTAVKDVVDYIAEFLSDQGL
jgi:hypothetical protein